MPTSLDTTMAQASHADAVLEAAYTAEFGGGGAHPDHTFDLEGRTVRIGDLRAVAITDLAERITTHPLLRRTDDTARLAALRFVERRLAESDKIAAFERVGSFSGFLRKVLSNLLLDWLRSPAGKAEVRRAEHDPARADPGTDVETTSDEPLLPREHFERQRWLTLTHLVATRAIQAMPPGRGVPLRLALWPAYEHDLADVSAIASFAHGHETAHSQAESRACDAGRRCTTPTAAWQASYERELDAAKAAEPDALSRRAVVELLRIGLGKPMAKREGAICERISKARLQLIEELRRAGMKGPTP